MAILLQNFNEGSVKNKIYQEEKSYLTNDGQPRKNILEIMKESIMMKIKEALKKRWPDSFKEDVLENNNESPENINKMLL